MLLEVFLDMLCIHQVDIAALWVVEVPQLQIIDKVGAQNVVVNNLGTTANTGTRALLVALRAER